MSASEASVDVRAERPHTAAVTQPARSFSAPEHPCRDARGSRRGFTLLEAALVISITGMVLAVAVPTFVRTLETSKAAEASEQLATLFRSSAAYYAVARPTTGPTRKIRTTGGSARCSKCHSGGP